MIEVLSSNILNDSLRTNFLLGLLKSDCPGEENPKVSKD